MRGMSFVAFLVVVVVAVNLEQVQASCLVVPSGSTGAATIPNSITTLADDDFANCLTLKTLIIPSSVRVIMKNAFVGATNLENVNYDCTPYLMNVEAGAFAGTAYLANGPVTNDNCRKVLNLKSCADVDSASGFLSLVAPTEQTYIIDRQFESCSALTKVKIPASIDYVGGSAFGNSGLAAVEFECSSTPLRVEASAFYNTLYQSTAFPWVADSCRNIVKLANCYDIDINGHLEIPEGQISVADEAFADCAGTTSARDLVSVNIASTVNSIGYRAFSNNNQLTKVTFPEPCSSAITIGENAFLGSNGVKSVQLSQAATCNNCGVTFESSICLPPEASFFDGKDNVVLAAVVGGALVLILLLVLWWCLSYLPKQRIKDAQMAKRIIETRQLTIASNRAKKAAQQQANTELTNMEGGATTGNPMVTKAQQSAKPKPKQKQPAAPAPPSASASRAAPVPGPNKSPPPKKPAAAGRGGGGRPPPPKRSNPTDSAPKAPILPSQVAEQAEFTM